MQVKALCSCGIRYNSVPKGAGIARLPSRLGIKRSFVKQYDSGLVCVEGLCLLGCTVRGGPNQCDDDADVAGALVAGKVGWSEIGDEFVPKLANRELAGTLPSRATAGFLGEERRVETGFVDAHPALLGNELGQIERKAVGIR